MNRFTLFVVRSLPFALLLIVSAARAQMPTSAPVAAASTSQSLLNPNLSLEGLFALSQFNVRNPLVHGGHDPRRNGFNLQQAEISIDANVDPYFALFGNIVLAPDEAGELKPEIEELYGLTLALPANFQLKAGQFYTAIGRNNTVHPHAWDYANRPLVIGRFFGGDGLRNPGVQASWLTPLPWYSELFASAQNANGETAPSFLATPVAATSGPKDLFYDLRWTHFVPFGEEWSASLGNTWLTGPNSRTGRTNFLGADLYVRRRAPGEMGFFFLKAEYLKRYYTLAYADPTSGRTYSGDSGAYLDLQYRFNSPNHRWQVGVRYDWVSDGAPLSTATGSRSDSERRTRISPVVTYYPSEMSRLRLQFDQDRADYLPGRLQYAAHLQFEIAVGPHHAHQF